MGKDSAAGIELSRSFHQMGTVNEKVCESDFASLRWYNNASFTCRMLYIYYNVKAFNVTFDTL